MKKTKNQKNLEQRLLSLQKRASHKPITVEKILHILSGKGRSLTLILLSIPFCQPIQIPGLSTPFGLAIAFVGLRMAFGKSEWLPRFLLDKKIKPVSLKKMTDKALKLVRFIQRFIHPRLDWICHYEYKQIVNGIIFVILGVFLALPLPIPLSNLAAAWAIFLIALGILEDDGLFILIGYIFTLLTLGFFAAVILTLTHIF